MVAALDEQHGRPKSVVLFEAVSILVAVAHLVLHEGASRFGDGLQLLGWVGVTLWVTRGRSRVARLVYTGLLLFGTAGVILAYVWGQIPEEALLMVSVQALVILGVLLSLLWWPSTAAWLRAAHERT